MSVATRLTHSSERVQVQHVFDRPARRQYALLVAVWVAVNVYFWLWWLRPDHAGNVLLYTSMSVALIYQATLLPSFFLFYLGQMRHPVHVPTRRVAEAGIVADVAVISLTVPGSEALHIVKQQLEAMTEITFPHDSWILVDKEHSPEIEQLAGALGVSYFSRHDEQRWGKERVAAWNRSSAPFTAKTKAGNVNSWIDAFGDRYSHFTQLDIDHLPVPGYLDRVLGYFIDRKVAWVQAPSVYGNHDRWTARGSSEQELVLQGPLQMGFFGFCRTPFIIGSHCTYDMQAIRSIGGFQPTRAEDHLDTVLLASIGREGVYVPEVIAVGHGPEDIETYLSQQFAWAFSMFQVLFSYTPKLVLRYTARQALQFLFVQTWYLFWSMSTIVLFALPSAALVFNTAIARVFYPDFLLHSLPVAAVTLSVWMWSRKWHLANGPGLSWRGVVLHIARWVVVLSAFVQVVFRVRKPYMITVKGLRDAQQQPFPFAILMPYVALIVASLAACWCYLAAHGSGASQGYLFFALQGAGLFLLLLLIILVKDLAALRNRGVAALDCLRWRSPGIALIAVLAVLFAGTATVSYHPIVDALLRGARPDGFLWGVVPGVHALTPHGWHVLTLLASLVCTAAALVLGWPALSSVASGELTVRSVGPPRSTPAGASAQRRTSVLARNTRAGEDLR